MQEVWNHNKKMLIIAGVIVFVLLIGVGAFFVLGQKHQPVQAPTIDDAQQANLPTLKPSDIGMSLEPSRGGKSVTMTVTKLDGITSMDYEVVYTADNSGSEVPRGIIGHIDIMSSDTQKSQEVVLGTCSDVCHYDKVVSAIKFSVKITKSDGKVYQVDDSITL